MRLAILSCLALCAASANAQAQGELTAGWSYQLTPYLWMTGLKGDVGTLPSGEPASIDLSFRDILDNLETSGMLFASARNGPWTILLDLNHTQLSTTEPLGGLVFSDAQIESTTTAFALAAGRTLAETDQMSATAYVGARAWWIENTTELRTVAGGSRRQTDSDSWVDPLIGVTGQFTPNDRWVLTSALEYGGFGVGADHEWSAWASATYRFSERFGVSFGWRYLEVDYRSGDTVFDVRQSGPLLGATFLF